MQVLNSPRQSGRFDIKAQFPKYKEVLYRPNFEKKLLGKPVVFDMDMSTGDFLTLLYLLKTPVEIINLKVWCYSVFSFLKPITMALFGNNNNFAFNFLFLNKVGFLKLFLLALKFGYDFKNNMEKFIIKK